MKTKFYAFWTHFLTLKKFPNFQDLFATAQDKIITQGP